MEGEIAHKLKEIGLGHAAGTQNTERMLVQSVAICSRRVCGDKAMFVFCEVWGENSGRRFGRGLRSVKSQVKVGR